jgi:hypothetical protein
MAGKLDVVVVYLDVDVEVGSELTSNFRKSKFRSRGNPDVDEVFRTAKSLNQNSSLIFFLDAAFQKAA